MGNVPERPPFLCTHAVVRTVHLAHAYWAPSSLPQDFLRNSRGINEGSDLDETYMCELYDRIVNNEIKLKDDFMSGQAAPAQAQARDAGLFSALMGLIPGGRKQQAVSEPSDDAIKRTHDFLRCVRVFCVARTLAFVLCVVDRQICCVCYHTHTCYHVPASCVSNQCTVWLLAYIKPLRESTWLSGVTCAPQGTSKGRHLFLHGGRGNGPAHGGHRLGTHAGRVQRQL